MLEQIGSMASIISFLTNVMNWTQRRFARGGIRVEAMLESGTVTREYGFTEKALKVTVMNESESEIKIRDIRLIFCGAYGASVAPEAPQGRSHSELPVSLDSGMEKDWYIPVEKPPNSSVPYIIRNYRPSLRGRWSHFTQDALQGPEKCIKAPHSNSPRTPMRMGHDSHETPAFASPESATNFH